MSLPPPRQIVLDDTDPSISYSGPGWQATTGDATKDFGNMGLAYNDTLHQVSAVGASFSFQFDGTAVTIFGSLDNSNGKLSPQWLCLLDGVAIGNTTTITGSQNSQPLCSASNFDGALHNVTVSISSSSQIFYFDYVFYTPSSTAQLTNAVVQIPRDDPKIYLIGYWSSYNDTWPLTTNRPDTIQLAFYGTSVTFLAIFPGELDGNQSSGRWSIDSSPQTTFIMGGHPAGSPTLYHQVMFTTPDVEPGPHNLTVSYWGIGDQAPLAIDYLLVTNRSLALTPTDGSAPPSRADTLVFPSPSSNPTGPPLPPIDNPSHGTAANNTGTIVGGVVGGVALLVCAAFLAFWLGRRSVSPTVEHVAADSDDEIEGAPRPYMEFPAALPRAATSDTPPPRNKQQSVARRDPLGIGLSTARAATPGRIASERLTVTSSMASSGSPERQMAAVSNSLLSHASLPSAGAGEIVQAASDPLAVLHADSGLRLQTPQLIDLPPTYTAN